MLCIRHLASLEMETLSEPEDPTVKTSRYHTGEFILAMTNSSVSCLDVLILERWPDSAIDGDS